MKNKFIYLSMAMISTFSLASCNSFERKVDADTGKEIVAKDNEVSLLRNSKPAKAYFNCHTDITIPYDELGEITALCPDGREIAIIKEGRFVLAGTELLNEALDEK